MDQTAHLWSHVCRLIRRRPCVEADRRQGRLFSLSGMQKKSFDSSNWSGHGVHESTVECWFVCICDFLNSPSVVGQWKMLHEHNFNSNRRKLSFCLVMKDRRFCCNRECQRKGKELHCYQTFDLSTNTQRFKKTSFFSTFLWFKTGFGKE